MRDWFYVMICDFVWIQEAEKKKTKQNGMTFLIFSIVLDCQLVYVRSLERLNTGLIVDPVRGGHRPWHLENSGHSSDYCGIVILVIRISRSDLSVN